MAKNDIKGAIAPKSKFIKKSNPDRYYVDNKQLYAGLVLWKEKCQEAAALGKDKPQPPSYVSHSLLNIVMGMSKKNNFKNYTYVDEMIADGLENIVLALPSFKTDKGINPFGYFSLVVYYAFVRRIQKEQKQTYIKYKIVENMALHNDLAGRTEMAEQKAIEDILSNEKMVDLVSRIETADIDKKALKNPKKKSTPLPKKQITTVWRRSGARKEI